MRVLHIFRSEPDETVRQMVEIVTNGDDAKQTPLFGSDVDWSQLVDDILSHDKVISWW